MKKIIILFFLIYSFSFSNELEKNKKELLLEIKTFKTNITPFVGKDLISILNDIEKEVKKEKKQTNLDFISLIYLDMKFKIINNVR